MSKQNSNIEVFQLRLGWNRGHTSRKVRHANKMSNASECKEVKGWIKKGIIIEKIKYLKEKK